MNSVRPNPGMANKMLRTVGADKDCLLPATGEKERQMSEPSYRDRLREEILALAGRLLETEGLDALQARRIAKEADCSVGTIYNIFGDIDGLILAANSRTLTAMGRALTAALDEAKWLPVKDRLMALAIAYMHFALENQPQWEAVFKYRRPPGAETPPAYLDDQARLLALIEGVIGEIVPVTEHRARTARALFGAVHGIVALALDNRLGGRMRAEIEDQVKFIVDIVARGLTTSVAV